MDPNIRRVSMGTVQTDEWSGPCGWKPRPLNFEKKTQENLRIMKTLLNRPKKKKQCTTLLFSFFIMMCDFLEGI
jgi:hypothetical protein